MSRFGLGLALCMAIFLSWPVSICHSGELVSIVKLLATPERYDNKSVEVVGYVVLEMENVALYLSRSDAKAFVTKNALWLDIPEGLVFDPIKVNGHYASIEGVFSAEDAGQFSGTIKRIGKITPSITGQ